MKTAVSVVVGVIILGLAAWFLKDRFISTPQPQLETVATTTWATYTQATTTGGFSIEYPPGYSVNAAHVYSFSPTKSINGVSFTVPMSVATGTNLSSDSYVSVEQLPRAKKCTGDIYLQANVNAREVVDGGATYSFASSTGAAAGNRYEEIIYALPNSSPCTAVRYYIHSTELTNYLEGTVRAYERAALLLEFDKIRQSLRLQ